MKMKQIIIPGVMFMLTLSVIAADMPTPQKGSNNYIEYYPGTLPLILTTPHGGSMKPASIPDRTVGCLDGTTCTYSHTCGTTNET